MLKARNLNDADWAKFREQLESRKIVVHDIWTAQIIEIETRALVRDIDEALETACPSKLIKSCYQKPKYWNNEVAKARSDCRKAYKAYQKSDEKYVKWAEYLETRTKFRRTLRLAKRTSWRNFCEEISSTSGMAKFKKILQSESNHTVGILSDTNSPGASVEALLDVHFPGSIPAKIVERDDHQFDGWTTEESVTNNNNPSSYFITDEKIRKAIVTFGPGKAAGPDGIKPLTLRHLGQFAILRLQRIYRACLQIGYIPIDWRKSKVVFIPKPNKEDYTIPKAFRPISLTSFLFKVLERLVLWEMEVTCLKDHPIHRHQHAFRHGSSTETALSALVDKIERAVMREEYAMAAFLDISGAFDNLSTEAAVEGMLKHCVPDFIIKWYTFYLKNRFAEINIRGIEWTRRLTKGTPQGGVLSPPVWDLSFDGFLEIFDSGPIDASGYADDGNLLATGIDPFILREMIVSAMKKAIEWGARNGLTFGAEKTEIVLFTRKRSKNVPSSLTINGTEIKFVKKVKYLGVTLDSELNFNEHIEGKIKKAKALLFMISKSIGKLWGPSPKLTKWAFTGMVRPMLSYGAIVWGKTLENAPKTRLDRLNRLNRLAALMMASCKSGTPTASLEVILDLKPLDLFIVGEAIKAGYRTKNRNLTKWDGIGNKSGKVGHRLWAEKHAKELGLTSPLDEGAPKFTWHKNFKVDKSSFEKGDPIQTAGISCYTDGSRTDSELTGWGFCAKSFTDDSMIASDHGCLGPNATVFQAEVWAIRQAAERLRNVPETTVFFFVDSQAALMALDASEAESETVQRCIEALNELGLRKTVILRWVKAHVGHDLNEMADELAKKGSKGDGPHSILPLPKTVVKTTVSSYTSKIWEQRWRGIEGHRQTKSWYSRPDKGKSEVLINHDRRTLSTFIQFITGFNLLGYHQRNVKGPAVDPTCRLCLEEIEDAWHLVADCPALVTRRREIFSQEFLQPDPPWTVSQVVRFISLNQVNRLLSLAEVDQNC